MHTCHGCNRDLRPNEECYGLVGQLATGHVPGQQDAATFHGQGVMVCGRCLQFLDDGETETVVRAIVKQLYGDTFFLRFKDDGGFGTGLIRPRFYANAYEQFLGPERVGTGDLFLGPERVGTGDLFLGDGRIDTSTESATYTIQNPNWFAGTIRTQLGLTDSDRRREL